MSKKQCVVIGLGRFGFSVAENLSSLGNDVLAIDIKEDIVRYISNNVSHAVVADVKEEGVLQNLGIEGFDVGVVAIGEDVESACMAILGLKKQGVKYIVAKAKSHTSGKILRAVGADRVIYPERDMGIRVAHNIFSPNIVDFLEFSNDYSIVEFYAPNWTIGKSILDLHIREKYHINIVAIKNSSSTNVDIQSSTIISEGDILIAIGNNKNINKFNKKESH